MWIQISHKETKEILSLVLDGKICRFLQVRILIYRMKKEKKIKIKSLCKLTKKEVEANLAEIALLVNAPQFICEKCARASNTKKILCHPHSI